LQRASFRLRPVGRIFFLDHFFGIQGMGCQRGIERAGLSHASWPVPGFHAVQIMKILLPISVLVLAAAALHSFGTSGRAQETSTRFDATLKKEILSNHQRHTPKVTVSGNEVRLTYGSEMEWTKDPVFDQAAKEDAVDCFQADYAALKADPRHSLHDYFHVIEYNSAHQLIGEATLMLADYPSAAENQKIFLLLSLAR
jgi:hypothetical protein